MSWQEIASSKRASLAASIPSEWRIPPDLLPKDESSPVISWPTESGFFTPRELELTSLTAGPLLSKLRDGIWTSEEVTRAYCKRAAAGQQLLNCLSETLFTTALSRAKDLDAHFLRTGEPIGPLHGLPISLKDNFEIAGLDSTLGFVSWVSQPAGSNATLVDVLLSLGSVLYVKTNVPTAMMIAESVNNTFGRTVNPFDRKLTSGGSSGGESALIAFGGSCLGVGTDIGGSLRIPAACTGIFTIRPSLGRFPTGGAKSGLMGQEAVMSVNGPMGRTLEDLEVFASAVVGAEPWRVDPRCVPIPWRKVEVVRKLKVGVMWSDEQVRPTPPVRRALKHTVDKLRMAGHEVVDWAPTDHTEIAALLQAFFVADGGKTVKSILDPTSEPWRPEMSLYRDATEIGVSELWKLQARRAALVTAYLTRVREAGLDAILCPTMPYAAVESGKFRYVGYTGVWNVLDYAAVSFPTGLVVEKGVDAQAAMEESLGKLDDEARRDYDPAAIDGMPISLQLVVGRLEEEKAIAMTRMVLDSLRS